MGKLDGKIALITGATSGMGEAFARLFAQEGAQVVLVGRSIERGERICREIKTAGGHACFMECDVSEEENVRKLRRQYGERYDRLDILVNNAGILLTSPLEEIDAADWHRTFAVNTDAVMYMTKAFIDLVIAARGNILKSRTSLPYERALQLCLCLFKSRYYPVHPTLCIKLCGSDPGKLFVSWYYGNTNLYKP